MQGYWAQGYHSMEFGHFRNISQFANLPNFFYFFFSCVGTKAPPAAKMPWGAKILSLKSFGDSWGNSYISCSLVIIAHSFTCGERKISKYYENNCSKLKIKFLFLYYTLHGMNLHSYEKQILKSFNCGKIRNNSKWANTSRN